MLSRRELLASWPAIAAAAQHARQRGPFEFLSAQQARNVEAIAAQIIPTDETPGATEAGVVHFIDRALATFDRRQQPLYTKGLTDLGGTFATFAPQRQTEQLKAIEKTEFFEAVRRHTIMGFLANPEYGGNRDHTGWKLIGFSDAHVYRPPFGYYDREQNAR